MTSETIPKSVELDQQLLPQKSRDKLFVTLFIFSMAGGLWLSLQSVGYLLSLNVQTLMLVSVVFTVTSLNWMLNGKPFDEQVKYSVLCVVPIGLRFLFNLPYFQSFSFSASTYDFFTQASYTAQIICLWVLVAITEETFRATMMNFTTQFVKLRDKQAEKTVSVVLAVGLWLLFHFIQRPFDVILYRWYIIWLFASGLVMTYVMIKAGLGAAVLCHLLINLTA